MPNLLLLYLSVPACLFPVDSVMIPYTLDRRNEFLSAYKKNCKTPAEQSLIGKTTMHIFLKLFTSVLLLIIIFFLAGCENYAEKTHQSWVTPPPGVVYDDSTIFARVTQAIQSDPVLQGTSIEIKVNEGHVTLTGAASNENQITRINMHAWIVDGVKNVDNQVSVK